MPDTSSTIPEFSAKVGSQTIDKANNKGLEALVVEDHVDMMGCAQLTFNHQEVQWDSFKFGDPVEVSFGGSPDLVFKGYLTGIRHQQTNKGGHLVTVVALDETVKMGASRRTKVYEEKSDSDILQEVISAAGLTAELRIQASMPTIAYTLQRNESNLTFAKRIAARNGLLLYSGAKEGAIIVGEPQFEGSPEQINKDAVLALDYTFTPQFVPPKMTTFGWDYVKKKKVTGTGADGDLDKIGTGATATAETGQVWDAEGAHIADVFVDADPNAKAMAVGELNRLARNYLTGMARVIGKGTIRAGVLVQFSGLPMNPYAYVVSSRHVITKEDGYKTEFRFASNTRPGA